jgi:hypothetical protein
MRAKREMEEGLRRIRRERGKLDAVARAFESAILGTPEQWEELDRDIIHVGAREAAERYEPPPETPRAKRSRLYGWNKLMKGR